MMITMKNADLGIPFEWANEAHEVSEGDLELASSKS